MSETVIKTPPSHQLLHDKMDGKPIKRQDDAAQTPQVPVSAAPTPTPVAPAEPNETPDAQTSSASATSNGEPATPATPPAEATPAPVVAAPATDLSEDDFLALYQKMTGNKVKSIDDLKAPPKPPTKEELEAAEAREKTESLEWALGSGKIKKEDYDKAILERAKDNRAIALEVFTADLQNDDPKLSAADCEELFKDFYAEEEPEDSWKRRKALREMNAVAESHKAQFNTIDTIADGYREWKSGEEKYKAHTKQWKEVGKTLPKELVYEGAYKTVDGHELNLSVKVPVDEKIVSKLIGEYTQRGMEDVYSPETATPERIEGELMYHVKQRHEASVIPAMIQQLSEQIEIDVLARMKNARNPNQAMGTPLAPMAPKTPPSHQILKDKMDGKARR